MSSYVVDIFICVGIFAKSVAVSGAAILTLYIYCLLSRDAMGVVTKMSWKLCRGVMMKDVTAVATGLVAEVSLTYQSLGIAWKYRNYYHCTGHRV